MGMAHFSIDLREEFRAGVVDGWLADHAAGLTPNPCVRCNGKVRLDAMIELADRLGAQKLATGHYARTGVKQGRRAFCCGWRWTRARTRVCACRARTKLTGALALPTRLASPSLKYANTRPRRAWR